MTELSVLHAAREAPRGVALVRGEQQITFAELAERVRARMVELEVLSEGAQQGAGAAQLVALSVDESPATLEVLLALFELQLPVLPIHSQLTAFEREQQLASLPVRWVVEPSREGLRLETRRQQPDGLAIRLLEAAPQLAAIATSGSTGPPRVALLSRRAFLASAEASASRLGWRADDRWLLALPLAHIGGLSVVTRCLIARRAIVMLPQRSTQSSAQRLASAITQGGPTLLSLVPTQLDGLIGLGHQFQMPERVRVILTGGAATPKPLIAACAERSWPVLTSYGLTEACSQVATQRSPGARLPDAGVGKPLPGVIVELHGGVIHVRGPTLMTGYIGSSGLVCDPDIGFRTRDLGRFDADGCLHVLGRVDDAIITGGENVSPFEVEVVLEECPGVLEACVFGVADAHWGQLVAAALRVRFESEAETVIERAQAQTERRLAGFKRPRLYACGLSFARGRTGKLDRRATAELITARLQAPARAKG